MNAGAAYELIQTPGNQNLGAAQSVDVASLRGGGLTQSAVTDRDVRSRFQWPSHASQAARETRQGITIFDDLEKQMAECGTEHEDALDRIRKFYIISDDPSLVWQFLYDHRAVAQILLDAASYLREFFSGRVIFNLRVLIDESGSQALYAVVMWPGSVRDVREAFRKFDETWWLSRSRQASGYLAFTYELV